jgi:hypothetical protein
MGMFDDIEVLCPLPGIPDDHDRQFQTKSLECVLAQYVVDEHGGLWHHGEPVAHDGEIEFHDGRLAYVAWFRAGRLADIITDDERYRVWRELGA